MALCCLRTVIIVVCVVSNIMYSRMIIQYCIKSVNDAILYKYIALEYQAKLNGSYSLDMVLIAMFYMLGLHHC